MKDLFTSVKGKTAYHIASDSIVIVLGANWYRGRLSYDVAVPQKDDKGKIVFCNATYSENEIEVI